MGTSESNNIASVPKYWAEAMFFYILESTNTVRRLAIDLYARSDKITALRQISAKYRLHLIVKYVNCCLKLKLKPTKGIRKYNYDIYLHMQTINQIKHIFYENKMDERSRV